MLAYGKTFFCNEMCLFMIITTSNNKINETFWSKDHIALLSHEWHTIAKSIRQNLQLRSPFQKTAILNWQKNHLIFVYIFLYYQWFKFEIFLNIKVLDCKKLMTFCKKLYWSKFYQLKCRLMSTNTQTWTRFGLCIHGE